MGAFATNRNFSRSYDMFFANLFYVNEPDSWLCKFCFSVKKWRDVLNKKWKSQLKNIKVLSENPFFAPIFQHFPKANSFVTKSGVQFFWQFEPNSGKSFLALRNNRLAVGILFSRSRLFHFIFSMADFLFGLSGRTEIRIEERTRKDSQRQIVGAYRNG